jgi:hypothetical protein
VHTDGFYVNNLTEPVKVLDEETEGGINSHLVIASLVIFVDETKQSFM